MPQRESERLLPHLEHVDAPIGKYLFRADDPLNYVYFPEQSVVSMLITMENGAMVEVGMIGNEGIVGIRALFGKDISTYDAVVQIPDSCLRMKADVLRAEFQRGGELQKRLLNYTSNFMAQIAQTAACNRVHRVQQRLGRWLLTVRTWVRTDTFPITHEFLSHMLGTPRSEVTIAAGILRKLGYIRYHHGQITILNRQGLEKASCECYKVVRDELVSGADGSSALHGATESKRQASKPARKIPNPT